MSGDARREGDRAFVPVRFSALDPAALTGGLKDDINALLEQYEALGLHPIYEETVGQERYLLYDFTAQTGMAVMPRMEMTGPCGPRNAAGKTL